jgi:hypothetical protein
MRNFKPKKQINNIKYGKQPKRTTRFYGGGIFLNDHFFVALVHMNTFSEGLLRFASFLNYS